MDPLFSHVIAALVGALVARIGLEKRRKRGVTSAAADGVPQVSI